MAQTQRWQLGRLRTKFRDQDSIPGGRSSSMNTACAWGREGGHQEGRGSGIRSGAPRRPHAPPWGTEPRSTGCVLGQLRTLGPHPEGGSSGTRVSESPTSAWTVGPRS